MPIYLLLIVLLLFFCVSIGLYYFYRVNRSHKKYAPGTKMLIFDFDGTIVDSLPLLLECFNNNAAHYGFPKIDSWEQLRETDIPKTLRELDISPFKLFLIAKDIRRQMRSKIALLKPFPGIVSILTQLHDKGIPLGIVTSNSKENVEQFLKDHAINFFSLIYGGTDIFGKAETLKRLLTTYGLDALSVIYIGDETRDIEAARANKIPSAAVTWGLNSIQRLQEVHPSYLINQPQELLALADKV